MSKLSEIKELKEEFANNLNQSDKFEKTKGILQSFKSFCANHKLWLAGLSIPIALVMIDNAMLENARKPPTADEVFNSSMNQSIDKEYEKISKMSETEKAKYTAEKREKLKSKAFIIYELNYDLDAVNAVLAERKKNTKIDYLHLKEANLDYSKIEYPKNKPKI